MVDGFDAFKSCLACLEQIALSDNDSDEDMSALTRAELELSCGSIARLDGARLWEYS